MYSPQIINQHLDKFGDLTRHSPEEVADRIEHFNSLVDSNGTIKRPLTTEESHFINSELKLCRFDFKYWAERYGMIHLDKVARVGVPTLWKSQLLILRHLAVAEEEQYQRLKDNYPTPGLRVANHKARQLGATALSRLLTIHRLTLWPDQRSLAASASDQQTHRLYKRDRTLLDNLPWYIRPPLPWVTSGSGAHEKDRHIELARNNTSISYQSAAQVAGLGQGEQFEIAHLTECSSWPYPDIIQWDFFPTLPFSVHTLCILESTAMGRGGWWYEFTESVRKGSQANWLYVFVPWYSDQTKYRDHAPDDWNPSSHTVEHASMVERTSPRYMFGHTVHLGRDQLYWYERERASAQSAHRLPSFLSNFCATSSESFQHINQSAIPFDAMEKLRLGLRDPVAIYQYVSGAPRKPNAAMLRVQ